MMPYSMNIFIFAAYQIQNGHWHKPFFFNGEGKAGWGSGFSSFKFDDTNSTRITNGSADLQFRIYWYSAAFITIVLKEAPNFHSCVNCNFNTLK